MTPAVLVAQPGTQHAYESALAAQDAGLLAAFCTSLYDTGRGVFGRRAPRLAGRAALERFDAAMRRRRHPELDPSLVRAIPQFHIAATGARTLSTRVPVLRDVDFETPAHEQFDAAVGRLLRKGGERPRIVHAFEGTALRTLEAARELGLATILDVPSAHESFREEVSEEWRRFGVDRDWTDKQRRTTERVKRERELADLLMAPSEYVRDCLVRNGVDPARIVLLPYAVDPAQFAPPPEREDGVFRAVFTGSIGLRKGVQYLLEAWQRLDLPDSELVLIGTPDADGRALMDRYAGLHRWAGQLPKYRVHEVFGTADVFAFPTLAEGSAYVSYEAMALGLPVVTTPNCGSVARDGRDGFVVPARDVDALVERLRTLHDDPDLRRAMGRSARELILTRYTWRHYRESLAQVYRLVLDGERDVAAKVDFSPSAAA